MGELIKRIQELNYVVILDDCVLDCKCNVCAGGVLIATGSLNYPGGNQLALAIAQAHALECAIAIESII